MAKKEALFANLPHWLWSGDSAQAMYALRTAAPTDVRALLSRIRSLDADDDREDQDGMDDRESASVVPSMALLATMRMRIGVVLEKRVTIQWEQCQSSRQHDAALCMFDAYAIATWTSCHAEYLATSVHDDNAPMDPTLFAACSRATDPRLASLFDAHCLRTSSTNASNMEQILIRAVGSTRGWPRFLEKAMETDPSVRLMVMRALEVALTGLHPCLVPTRRASWKDRAMASRMMVLALRDRVNAVTLLARHAESVKDALRRLLYAQLSDVVALRNAASRLGHSIGHLVEPPEAVPHVSMLESMARFAEAGANLARSAEAAESVEIAAAKLEEVLTGARSSTTSTRCKVSTPTTPLVTHAAKCFADGFRAVFFPFWLRATASGMRPRRLDPAQHSGLHQSNAALGAAQAVPRAEALRIHRMVLSNPCASLMTVPQVCVALGLKPVDNLDDAGVGCGRLLVHARLAAVCEELLIVDLGRRTRSLHLAAIYWRHVGRAIPSVEMLENNAAELSRCVEQLPKHVTHLCVCCNCSRIANCAPGPIREGLTTEFCEVGVSSVTAHTDPCRLRPCELYCAKRTSAALRGALVAENAAQERRIENDVAWDPYEDGSCSDDDPEDTDPFAKAVAAMSHDGTIASRMRRDCRRAFEQRARAVGCAETPLLTVSLVGRAVRIQGRWYSLCCYCATCTPVLPHHRVDAEIACLRCCETHTLVKSTNTSASDAPTCRYCNKVQGGRGRPFAIYHSPKDVSGANASRPPQLRFTAWCRAHDRPWLREGLRALTSAQVLAHIALRAKPVTSEATEDVLRDDPSCAL